MATAKRSARTTTPRTKSDDGESTRRMHNALKHRIQIGRRIHELLDELDVALRVYEPMVMRDSVDDVVRFRGELDRMRGAGDIGCPILLELAHPSHVDREAFATLHHYIGKSGTALEEDLNLSRGYASKAKQVKRHLPAKASVRRCDRCNERAIVDATVHVVDEKTSRRVLERQSLCVDCYRVAIVDE